MRDARHHEGVRSSASARPRADEHQPGDKIGIKIGSLAGIRASVVRVRGDAVVVQVENGGSFVLPFDGITNYSRAARRAWKVMPKRAGRPRADHPRKKMVSLRLDIELIQRLDAAVRLGQTPNRSQAVADGVSAYLNQLGFPKASTHLAQPIENNRARSTG